MESPAKMPQAGAGEGEQALMRRIVAAPQLLAADEAHARVKAWLAEIADTPAGTALAAAIAAHPMVGTLLAGLAEGSPHLWELVRADADRLATLLEAEPERQLDAILDGATGAIAASHEEDEVMRGLRRMKADAALLIALADIGGAWPV